MGARLATRLLSLALLLALWQLAAFAANDRALPAPAAVLAFVVKEFHGGELVHNVGITLVRVALAFSLAMLAGIGIGIALGRLRRLDRLVDPWLLILLNTPALVVIVLSYVWLGLTEAAAVTAVAINKIPNVAVIMREGARSLDPQLEEMRRSFRFDTRTWLAHVVFPQLQPYAVAAARSGLALVWKIVLVVELLGRPDGVGYAISYHFQLFDVAALIGYSLVFTSIVLAIDFLVLQPMESHARRWRIALDPA